MHSDPEQFLFRLLAMSLLVFHLKAQVPVWQLGIDNQPTEASYRPMGEFSSENHANDPIPGKVTRIPGDPLYDAANVAPPDDDFYFSGIYPAGFNGLTGSLVVPNPEPTTAWERAHTKADQTNRIHFVLSASQVAEAAQWRLTVELPVGGETVNGQTQPGMGLHDMVIRWRNGSGATTTLYTGRISSPTLLVIEKAASEVAASAGPNTIEVVRIGPIVPGTSSWIGYDFARLEAITANRPPLLTPPSDVSVDELSLLRFPLQATDPDVPAQTLTYSLVSGPDGLSVDPSGMVNWIPTEAQGPGEYPVSVRVTDSGTPGLSDTRQFIVTVNEVPDPVSRTLWQIGTDNLRSEVPYAPSGEFSSENSRNDPAPGLVTRVPGDPQYNASTNPSRDDDFYFSGVYPAGFNGLAAPLLVPNDEPPSAWERAHTPTDLTNRVHFVLDPGLATATTGFRLRMEFTGGTTVIGGVTQPGIGQHSMVIQFRNGVGTVTPLYSQQLTQAGVVQVEFLAGTVQATAGANTIEVVRTGPLGAGITGWILYDYLRLEALNLNINTPPVLTPPGDRVIDELSALTITLQATDADVPAQALTYSMVSGPTGMQVSPGGALNWTPTEAQGPGVHPVTVRVTDNGSPPLSDTATFQVTVNEINSPPSLASVPPQNLPELAPWSWDLVPSDSDLPANGLSYAIQEGPSGMTVTAQGRIEWLPGEAEGPAQHLVTVRVTDDGTPPLSGTVQFQVEVQEVNQPPVISGVPDQTATEATPLALTLSASDADLPPGLLSFRLESGPAGLQVSSAGAVEWKPSPAYDDTTNEVVVSVTDWGTPPLSDTQPFKVVVPKATPRSWWAIGVQDDPLALPYLPSAELGEADGLAGSGPGAVTRRAGDYAYDETTNPPADDDYYFRGFYPAGFNGNTAGLDVASDEPAAAWERRLTTSDPANRLHFVLMDTHLVPTTHLTLSIGFPAGGVSVNGIPQAGFGIHDLELWFRNGAGASTRIRALRLDSATNLTVDFLPTVVGATSGANTLEIVRVGPSGAGADAWLDFDYLTLAAETRENQPPTLNPVADLSVEELSPVNFSLVASDGETPTSELHFSLVSGPAGLTVSPNGEVAWTPAEFDGPGTFEVTVQVTDDSLPPLSDTTTFSIEVHEANLAPTLSEVPPQTTDELATLSLTLSASDPDAPANNLTYSLLSGPVGLTVSPAGAVSWTPIEADGPGTFEVTVQVTDDGAPPLSDTTTFSIEVHEANSAPTLSEVPPQTTDELVTLSLTLSASDPDAPANNLTYSLLSGPVGLTVSPAGAVSWTPTEADGPGTFEVTVQVTDDGAPPLSDTTTFSIEVHEANSAPTLTDVPPQTTDELVTLSLTLSASDAETSADHLTYSLLSGPAGLTVSPAGAVSWTPTEADGPGTFEVTVQVTDDGVPPLSDTTTVSIEVHEANSAPTLTDVPPQTTDELVPLAFTLSASDSDVPVNHLTYSLLSGPTGLTVSPAGAVSWTPAETDGPGSFEVTVQVTDDGVPPLSDTTTFSIEVHEINSAPTLSEVPPQTTDELVPLTFTLSASDPDAPANQLTYSLLSGPAGLTVSPAGAVSWTPAETDGPGSFEVTVQVTDDGVPPLSDTTAFSIEVLGVNSAPTLSDVPPQTTDELAPFSFALSASDADTSADHLTYSLLSGPAGLTVSPAGAVSWTPTEADGPGTFEVTVQVTDDGVPPLSDTTTFSIEVHEANSAPTLTDVPPQTTDELATLTLTLSALDPDVPANHLTYSLLSGPVGLSVSPAGAVSWTPTEADGPGTFEVQVQVTDDGAPPLSATTTFSIQVQETNSAPTLAAIPARSIEELTSLNLTLSGSDADLPVQSLVYSLVEGPPGLTVSPAGAVNWVPGEDQGPSTNLIKVQVSDSGVPSLSAPLEFTVMVDEVNLPPVLDDVPLQTVDPVNPWSFQLTATDPDLPANALAYDLVSGPAGLTVSPEGRVLWDPTPGQRPSTNSVTVRVDDNGTPVLSDTRSFTVVANKTNSPPVLAPIADVTIDELQAWTLQLSGSDPDQPAGTLLFSKHQGPPGLSVSSTGTVLWTPGETDGSASHQVSIILTDTSTPPLSVTNQFTVTVREANQAPALPELPTQYVTFGSSLVILWAANDLDLPKNSLSHRRISGPDGLKVNRAGLVTWTPVASQAPSTNIVQVAVTDDGTPGLSTTNQFVVVCVAATRSVWQIGTDDNPAVSPYKPLQEFSAENGKNDAPPGKVTRLPGDPNYVAASNPTADDDFYFSGLYSAGFNGLTAPLTVPNDEPPIAWERAITSSDRTNRMHFVVGAGEVFPASTLQLSFELLSAGSSVGGVGQSGFAEHIVVVQLRNPLGATTVVYSNGITAATNVVLTLSNTTIGVAEGPNTIEFIRTGPNVSGTSYWIQFDYVRLQLNQGQPVTGDLSGGWAADNYLDPNSAADLASDRDFDGLTALQEFNRGAQSTDPNKVDTDEDGLSDAEERALGSNPLLVDTDGDGLSDYEEVHGIPPSSPLAMDSDGDGASDLLERRLGTDPEDPMATPSTFRGGIAFNFVSATDPNGVLGPNAVAGRVPQMVWNQTAALPSSGRPTGGKTDIASPVAGQIVRSDGLVLPAVQIAWSSDSATANGNRGSGDQVLMNGMLRASLTVPVSLTVSNIPFARYDVYVYVGSAWDGKNGRLRLGTDAGTDRYFTSFSSAPQAAFIEIPPGTNAYTQGNLIRYSGLTSPRFTLALTNPAVPPSTVSLGIHALQIVDADLDGDLSGIPDWWELLHGLDPRSSPPLTADTDGDGLTTMDEYQRGSNPRNSDTDQDGIADGLEAAANSVRYDSDGDGLSDQFEVTTTLPSNPNLADTDGDGDGDGTEYRYRSDPGFRENSSPTFTGWTPRYSASPARWEWNLENIQLVWDHGSGEMDLDQNNEDQLITFAVRNTSSSDARTLEISLRYYRGVLNYTLKSTANGGFSAPGTTSSQLLDSPTGGRVTDLTRLLGFSGHGPADISDRIRFRLMAQRSSSNSWTLSFEIWNQTRNQLLVSRGFDNCRAAASVDNGTAVWSDTEGTVQRAALEPHKGVTLFFSPTPLESRAAFAAIRDTDDDGMPDLWEDTYGLDRLNPADAAGDLDNDRLANLQEYLRGTDPRRPDTDGDHIPDGLEVANASNPNDPASRPLYAGFSWPSNEDLDGNGLPDAWEIRYRAFGLPLNGDADGDGYSNSQEALWGTNPFDAQSRIALTFTAVPPDVELRWPLQPLKRQTLFWKSGASDWVEYTAPPLTVNGFSFVRLPDRIELEPTELYRVDTQDQDYDGDGVSDWAEGVLGSDPFRADSIRSSLRVISGSGQIGGLVSGDYVNFIEQFRKGPVTASQAVSRIQAARFLQQTTFGATRSELDRVQQMGFVAWIENQIATPPTFHLPYLQGITEDFYGPRHDSSYSVNSETYVNSYNVPTSFARAVLSGPDQLRQRVAFALSQILVISRNDNPVRPMTQGSYYDILVHHAFGSYFDLLREVTFHSAMGSYLSSVGNQKARPEVNQYPDENYAREVMQLFTIGLWELNPDGSHKRYPNGDSIPTYGNREITEFARVFTGLWFGGKQWGRGGDRDYDGLVPMDLWPDRHDFESKTLLRGFVIPARFSSKQNATRDVDDALRSLVEHPNTAPFIGRQLIQFLVTSNPTTNYVARVSAVFNNDGTGRRGNLAAVVRAILLDPEARDPEWAAATPSYGRLKEPVHRAMNLARVGRLGRHPDLQWWNVSEFYRAAMQDPLRAPSVFNFFRPNYQPPGLMAAQGLVGPAFQILDSYSSISFPNKLWEITERGFIQASAPTYTFSPDYTELLAIAEDTPRLLDEVNLLFCGGQMNAATRKTLRDALEQVAPYDRLMRVQLAVYLASTCPDGAIQR